MLDFFNNNKWKIIISSMLILVPMAVGAILWNVLPDVMAVHWGFSGEADGFAGKGFVVFGMPLILLAFHLLCLFASSFDKKNREQSKKVFTMVFFTVPFVSFLVFGIMYAAALDINVDVASVCLFAFGILFAVIGNYLPKCRQNSTIGVKIKWTLENEGNWNATHRAAGRIWLIGGILMMLTVFLPRITQIIAFFVILFIMVVVPIVYSYVLYRKQSGKGR